MFEYLMPPIFLPGQRDTLLGESEMAAVEFQRMYGREHGVPWAFRKSAFATTDSEGQLPVSRLRGPGARAQAGPDRGSGDSAPMPAPLALCCWPGAAVENMRALEKLGAVGLYGFHDAHRLYAGPGHGGPFLQPRAKLHGASSRHDHDGNCQRPRRRYLRAPDPGGPSDAIRGTVAARARALGRAGRRGPPRRGASGRPQGKDRAGAFRPGCPRARRWCRRCRCWATAGWRPGFRNPVQAASCWAIPR